VAARGANSHYGALDGEPGRDVVVDLVTRYCDHRVGAIIAESRHPRRERPVPEPTD
jgi:hypothetical protein